MRGVLLGLAGVIAAAAAGRPDDKPEGELAVLVQAARGKDLAARLKAVEAIGAKGEAGRPAARDLCDLLADPNPKVRTAALNAVEKVRPDLYKPLSTLLLDREHANRRRAVHDLGRMGDDARPAAGLLVARLRADLAVVNPDADRLTDELIDALSRLRVRDAEAGRLYKAMAGAGTRDPKVRGSGLSLLWMWAEEDVARRKEVVPYVRAAVDHPELRLRAVGLAGALGPLARDMVPTLARLKQSPDMATREAAAAALRKVEGP